MSLHLPTEVLDQIDQGEQPVYLEDPRSHEEYVLVPKKEYELLRDSGGACTKRGKSSTGKGDVADEWNEAMNARRFELVDREIDGTLAAGEIGELQDLQDKMLAFRRKVAPLPIDELRELHQQLLEQAQQSSRGD